MAKNIQFWYVVILICENSPINNTIKNIISVVNSQRLNVAALENLLANHNKRLKRVPTIEDLVQANEEGQ